MFFSYDHEDGIEFHDTAEQAKARAEAALDGDRDYADEGWNEEVIQICWGEVKQRVCETSRRKVEPEEGKDYEEEVDYGLRDTDNAEHQARCQASPECSCSPLDSGGAK